MVKQKPDDSQNTVCQVQGLGGKDWEHRVVIFLYQAFPGGCPQ